MNSRLFLKKLYNNTGPALTSSMLRVEANLILQDSLIDYNSGSLSLYASDFRVRNCQIQITIPDYSIQGNTIEFATVSSIEYIFDVYLDFDECFVYGTITHTQRPSSRRKRLRGRSTSSVCGLRPERRTLTNHSFTIIQPSTKLRA